MALTAVLEFGDNGIRRYSKQYQVSDCRFVFDRPSNAFSPEGAARCERLEVVVIAPGKTDLSMFEWFSNQDTRDGRIVISLANEGRLDEFDTQTIFFNEARCFSLSERYDIDNQRRRLLRLAIVADRMEVDGVGFEVRK